jgi:hypothetical protein
MSLREVLELWLRQNLQEKSRFSSKQRSRRQAILSRGRRLCKPYGAPEKRLYCPRLYRPVLRLFWVDSSNSYMSFSWLSRG